MTFYLINNIWWPRPEGYPNLQKRCFDECKQVMKHVPKGVRHTAIQAGGNVGLWPLFLADRFEKVFTFEPEPMNYAALVMNCRSRRNIVPIHAAVGEEVGMIRLIEKGMTTHQTVPKRGDLPCWSIDTLGVEDCDLLMLDVEGSELPALRGAVETIRRSHPVLAVEINWLHDRVASETELRGWLEAEGYREVAKVTHDRVFVWGEA